MDTSHAESRRAHRIDIDLTILKRRLRWEIVDAHTHGLWLFLDGTVSAWEGISAKVLVIGSYLLLIDGCDIPGNGSGRRMNDDIRFVHVYLAVDIVNYSIVVGV